jgi:hypothetical protein
MEIELGRDGPELAIRARGSREERRPPHRMNAAATADLLPFTARVREAALRGRPLGPLLPQAQDLHRALFREGVAELRASLTEAAAGEPLLLRLAMTTPDLHAVPWEALCQPGSAMGFLASAPDLLPSRCVTTSEQWQPREVRGAVKILIIAPDGGASLARIQDALKDRVTSGEVELLPPIVGPAASRDLLFGRLRGESPHVIHFLGHGSVGENGPALRLASPGSDADSSAEGGESWMPVELFAQQLAASFKSELRLVLLEACEGAQPGALASAAEILASKGADAVIAHLWPVRFDVARRCSQQFYEALAGQGVCRGDVARSLNEARRAILVSFDGSAEAFSPVLYLRAPRATLFDFQVRVVAPPQPPQAPQSPQSPQTASASASAAPAPRPADARLDRLLARPFSLLLGDRWKTDRAALEGFRNRLHRELGDPDPALASLPMSALAQRFALRRGADTLEAEFQSAFQMGGAIPPVVAALARVLGPGVHTTLLRTPLLEQALAAARPDRTLYAIQPDRESTAVLRRAAGGSGWERLLEPLPSIDPDADIVVLRLYRGYRPDEAFSSPLLTEDDYLLGFRELQRALPPQSADDLLDALAAQPALITGLSLLNWHHRMLLTGLFGRRALPRRSLAVVDPEDAERDLWEKGTSLPGKEGVTVVDATAGELTLWLQAAATGDRR